MVLEDTRLGSRSQIAYDARISMSLKFWTPDVTLGGLNGLRVSRLVSSHRRQSSHDQDYVAHRQAYPFNPPFVTDLHVSNNKICCCSRSVISKIYELSLASVTPLMFLVFIQASAKPSHTLARTLAHIDIISDFVLTGVDGGSQL